MSLAKTGAPILIILFSVISYVESFEQHNILISLHEKSKAKLPLKSVLCGQR